MPENSSSYKHTSISFSPFIEENPYRKWSFWGAIITVCAVAITIAVATAGLTFGWPLAIAVIGALFTGFLFSAANSHNNTTERNKELAQRKEHEKELAKQMQIQQDKKIAQQMQMKEEEAKMEEAMRIIKREDRVYIPHQNKQVILQSLQKTLNSTQLFNQSQLDATWQQIITTVSTNDIRSSNIGFTKDGKISEIRINGGETYKATRKEEKHQI